MSLLVPCPTCGERPYTEFTFGGELRPLDAPDPEAEFARVYLRGNVAGVQDERWFHALGLPPLDHRAPRHRREPDRGWRVSSFDFDGRPDPDRAG